jgi:formylglycine-generating enzyme required for sulfatase activity
MGEEARELVNDWQEYTHTLLEAHARDLLEERSVRVPEGVFRYGQDYESVSFALRERDAQQHLGLRSLLKRTPPRWVHTAPFRIGAELVTNGDYLRFLLHEANEAGAGGGYEQLAGWQKVWNEHPAMGGVLCKRWDERSFFEGLESLSSAGGFVEAYLLSLRQEAELLLAEPRSGGDSAYTGGLEGEVRGAGMRTQQFAIPPEASVRKAFSCAAAYLPRGLAGHIPPDYSAPEPTFNLLTALMTRIEQAYRKEAGRNAREEPWRHTDVLCFLDRFRDALQRSRGAAPLPLRQLLYPRSWPRWEGLLADTGGVPWLARPVTGISFYEACAYANWLSRGLLHAGAGAFSLPTEVEYERAASWPIAAGGDASPVSPLRLDPAAKYLYPWGEGEADYTALFPPGDLCLNAGRFEYLLARSAHVTPSGQQLRQLLGFGWQWTSDRYSPGPPPLQPEGALEVIEEDTGRRAPVFRCADDSANRNAEFVLRGCPTIVAGQGLTTRRFALYGLRGYRDVALRWVVRPG